jgi:hypothetical protein
MPDNLQNVLRSLRTQPEHRGSIDDQLLDLIPFVRRLGMEDAARYLLSTIDAEGLTNKANVERLELARRAD